LPPAHPEKAVISKTMTLTFDCNSNSINQKDA
jgi:hypothetical protein